MDMSGKPKKYLNSSQNQRSRLNIINFQTLLAFTMGHIPTKLHQFLISSFRDFVRTDAQTDRRHQKQYLLAEVMITKGFTSQLTCNTQVISENKKSIARVLTDNRNLVTE